MNEPCHPGFGKRKWAVVRSPSLHFEASTAPTSRWEADWMRTVMWLRQSPATSVTWLKKRPSAFALHSVWTACR